VRNVVSRIGIIGAVGIGAFVLRPFMTGGAGELKVGECFDVPTAATTVEEVQHHPCTEAHIGEVFFVGKLPAAENAPYPTDAELDKSVEGLCVPAFDAYTGLTFMSDQQWTYGWFAPLSKDWVTGERGLICYATLIADEPTSTSIKKG
jgi:hypothetical protein